jgi:hypothetical protein
VTVVLFMNAESELAAHISKTRRRLKLPPASLKTQPTTTSSTPVSRSAPPMTKIEPRMMMMSLLKPANASAGVSTPVSTSAESRSSVMTSTESFSVAKRMIATTSKLRTMAICMATSSERSRPDRGDAEASAHHPPMVASVRDAGRNG